MKIINKERIPKDKLEYASKILMQISNDFQSIYNTFNPVELRIDDNEWYRVKVVDTIDNHQSTYYIACDEFNEKYLTND